MAVFDDKKELVRQAGYTAPSKATGFNKFVMAMAGYDDRGRKNTWGKINSFLGPIPFSQVIGNSIAKSAAEGTDARDVVEAQTSGDVANSLSRLKFAGNIISTIMTGGAAGGLGGVLKGGAGGLLKGGAGKDLLGGIGKGGISGVQTNLPDAVTKAQGIASSLGGIEGNKSQPLVMDEIDVSGISLPGGERMLDTDKIEAYNRVVRSAKKSNPVHGGNLSINSFTGESMDNGNSLLRIAQGSVLNENPVNRDNALDTAKWQKHKSANRESIKHNANPMNWMSSGLIGSGVEAVTAGINANKTGDAAYKDLLRKQRLENLNYL